MVMPPVFDSFFFKVVIVSPLVSSAIFLLIAIPGSFISWRDPAALSNFRIQRKRLRVEKVVWPSIVWLLVNTLALMLVLAVLWPFIKLSGVHDSPAPHALTMLWQIPLFVVIDDLLYYWVHRALHTKLLYRAIHSVHHRISAPWAIAGGYFHPVEYVLIMLCSLAGPFIIGAHLMTIWIWIALRQWAAAYGHCGYEFPWAPSRWIVIFPSPAYHDYHHSHFVGNYANYLSMLDTIFGTRADKGLEIKDKNP